MKWCDIFEEIWQKRRRPSPVSQIFCLPTAALPALLVNAPHFSAVPFKTSLNTPRPPADWCCNTSKGSTKFVETSCLATTCPVRIRFLLICIEIDLAGIDLAEEVGINLVDVVEIDPILRRGWERSKARRPTPTIPGNCFPCVAIFFQHHGPASTSPTSCSA